MVSLHYGEDFIISNVKTIFYQSQRNFDEIKNYLNDYGNVTEWIHDMRMMFQKIMNSFKDDSILYMISYDLNSKFENKVKKVPKTEKDEWSMKYSQLKKHLGISVKKN